ncbi:hypothetical protein [Simkania negevensis]|uniref:Uncharacterized protein n=1 Tax=Simkania negevensis (strain ATCC VR-1471 / DSM 27360 / Z) TaxID=331113 RepID=F8L8W3_SIMNZ|nr:hypothetical protein [Simkania negevensis]CCB89258.1 unknown protein [Simkania negevensis Z]
MMSWNHVGFAVGEPNWKPFFQETKKIGVHCATTVLSNLVLTVALNYFFPRWNITPHSATAIGLVSAISYTLTHQMIEYFRGDTCQLDHKYKVLLATAAVGSTYLMLGKTCAPRQLALAFLDVGILEVGLCSTP